MSRVLIDACVLYPTVMREVVLGVAATGAFEPLWSERILGEWRRAAARRGQDAGAEIALVAAAWPHALAPPGEEGAFVLPDPDDRHVLAAAVAGGADALMTLNVRDFPLRALEPHGVSRREPDAMLAAEASDGVAAVVEEVRARAERLSGEPWDRRPLLRKARLPRLARALDRLGGPPPD